MDTINPKSTYARLLKISQGDFSNDDRLKYDEIIYGISLNKSNPSASSIKLVFTRGNFIELFSSKATSEWEVSFAQELLSGYYGNVQIYDWDATWESWKDGYFLGDKEMGKDNYDFLKYKILPLLGMQPEDLENKSSDVAIFLDDLYESKIQIILDTIQDVQNECAGKDIRDNIIKDGCDILFSHGIYRKDCFHTYFATVKTLLKVYDESKNKNVDLFKALQNYIEENVTWNLNYEEYRYDYGCSNENYDTSRLEREWDRVLDFIYDDLTKGFDGDEQKVKEFFKLYNEINDEYVFGTVNLRKNTRTNTKKFKRYKIVGIDKETLKIIIQTWENDLRGEEPKTVKMTKDELYNFVNHPTLFDE